jgi:D-alanyl-D-alanine carboxypeptidase (penicillin-binding protein 5/6)
VRGTPRRPATLPGVMSRYQVTAALLALAVSSGLLATPAAPAPVPAAAIAERPAYVKCPTASVPTRPAHPAPPSRDPDRPIVGGDGLGTAGLAVPPDTPPVPTNVSARYWLVADLDTGAVLGACGPHEQSSPASVQKLLLTATVLPKLTDPQQVVQVTAADLKLEHGSSAVGLVTGGRYTVQTLFLGLLLVSGNDAANALARAAGGDAGVAGTIADMNALAEHLGALDTHAVTPSGLDGKGQYTSVYDLALIARVCFGLEGFSAYDTARTAQIPAQAGKGGSFQIQNENKLLANYKGALGGKTGYTILSRQTYVGAAERNGRRLVATLLNGEARPVRPWQQAASLLDWGFSLPQDAAVGRLVEPGELDADAEAAAAAANAHGRMAIAPRTLDVPPVMLAAAGGVLVLVVLLVFIAGRRHRRARRRRAAAAATTAAPPPAYGPVPRPRTPVTGPAGHAHPYGGDGYGGDRYDGGGRSARLYDPPGRGYR